MHGAERSLAGAARERAPRGAASRLDFLEVLFGGAEVGQIVLWRLSDKQSHWLPLDRLGEADTITTTRDVYLTVALHDQDLALQLAGETDPSRVRGSIGSAVAIPGLWADVDVYSPAHKRRDLPPTFADARALVGAFPLKPTVIVHSGFGLQAWWLFKEPWTFQGPEDRARAQQLARRFGATLQTYARERGWSIDDTADLARVLRLPGTLNCKLPTAVPVEIIEWRPDSRHEPGEFEPFLVEPAAPSPVHRPRPPEEWRALTTDGVSQGARNSSIAALAGHLLRREVDPFVVLHLLIAWNATSCRPPLPEAEVARTVNSIAGRELRRRQSLGF
jgi:hypothetical protein